MYILFAPTFTSQRYSVNMPLTYGTFTLRFRGTIAQEAEFLRFGNNPAKGHHQGRGLSCHIPKNALHLEIININIYL